METFTPTHALHNDRRRLVKNMEHFSLDNDILACHNSTMSGGVCTHDSLLRDDRSTTTGGGLPIENGFESPKHRVSLGLYMNYYVHRKHYIHSQWNTMVSHEWKTICTLKQFEIV